jgi:glycopeptide antibiotics resistance protein
MAPCRLCAEYQSFGELVTSVFIEKTSRVQRIIIIYVCVCVCVCVCMWKVCEFILQKGQENRRRVPVKISPVSFTSAKSLLSSEVV